jgi:hypothetical protein
MKRYFCTVAAGLALALMSTATASADIGLPLPGQSGTQETILGDQNVGEQKNDADVSHEQENWNVASPPVAIAVLGKSEAENEQTNVNVSDTEIEQDNEVEQDQTSTQEAGGTACCDGQSQAGEQKAEFGDQNVGEQKNDADVSHEQKNVNVLSPPIAIAVLGHAEASNEQKNVNYSETDVEQENEVESDQSSSQRQGGSGCCHGQSQAGEQKAYFGDQNVGEQKNDADVTHSQKNVNFLSPPVAVAILGTSYAGNEQTNVNVSKTEIDQENEVEQKQDAEQKQFGGGCCTKPAPSCSSSCEPKKDYGRSEDYGRSACCSSGSPAEQKTFFGDQNVGKQKNDADVSHSQKNVNVLSPPVALGILGKGYAENEQTNVNVSKAEIDQENEVEQKQDAEQKQIGGGCCAKPKPAPPCSNSCQPKKDYGTRPACSSKCVPNGQPSREQKVYFGDQNVGEQKNDADVTHSQKNVNFLSPPIALGLLGKTYAGNEQTNVNFSKTEIEQGTEVRQTQSATQGLVEMCRGLINR